MNAGTTTTAGGASGVGEAGSTQRRWSLIAGTAASLRVEGWISKLPALVLAAYAVGALVDVPSSAVSYAVGFCCLHLALGYTANDLADWRHDVAAGDKRAAHRGGRRRLAGLVIALAVINALYLAAGLWHGQLWPAWYGALTVALGFTYSFPPRLKGRGLLGVLFSAYIQWVTPMTMVLLAPGVRVNGVSGAALLAVVLLWLFSLGCHGALRHQIRDYDADLGRTATYAVVRGLTTTGRLLTVSRVAVLCCCGTVAFIAPGPAGLASALSLTSFSVYHLIYYKRSERR